MRVIVYTGKGGVGKTSIAAATALKSAQLGYKTIILSTDAAHSLGDSFNVPLSNEPQRIARNLWGQEIQALYQMERRWEKIQRYVEHFLESQGLEISVEELMVLPGIEELLNLLEILRHIDEGKYEVIVVDCAPSGQTLRLLSYPDLARWWLEKFFPIQRTAVKVLRPVAQPLLKMPLPSDDVLVAIADIVRELERMQQVLTDHETTSVRVVMNPEKMVIDETRRNFTYLNLFGFATDAVIINRLIPANVKSQYFAAWKEIQEKHTATIEESFSPVPIFKVPLLEHEVVGLAALEMLADKCFGQTDPTKSLYKGVTQSVRKEGKGYVMSINLPFVEKSDISMVQKGEELSIRIGDYRRNVLLPRHLAELEVQGAKLENGQLKIHMA
ncbi:MAG: ArsA family ATPase [Acidobacteriota bacterium]